MPATLQSIDNFVNGVIETILLLPFVIFYFNQSSRWLHHVQSAGNEAKQFILLRNIGSIITLSFALSSLLWTIKSYFTLEIDSSNYTSSTEYIWLRFFASIFFYIAVVALFTFEIVRLYICFDGTVFALTKPAIIGLCLLIACTVMPFGITVIIYNYTLQYNQTYIAHEIYLASLIISVIGVGLVPFVISMIFCAKLFKLMISMRSTIGNYNDEDLMDVQLSPRQVSLLDTITKQTLLAIIQTIFFVGNGIGQFIIEYFSFEKYPIFWVFGNTIIAISGVISPLCVWLSFIFAQDQYSVGCHHCHQQCGRCFTHLATNRLYKIKQQESSQRIPNYQLL